MRIIFWLILLLGILSVVFLFGNTLRCDTQRQVEQCPELCYAVKRDCDPELVIGCDNALKCKAIKLEEYPVKLREYFDKVKQELLKLL